MRILHSSAWVRMPGGFGAAGGAAGYRIVAGLSSAGRE